MRMFGLFGWILLLPPPNVAFEPFCVSGEEWFSHIMSGICFEKINWAITIVLSVHCCWSEHMSADRFGSC